MLSHQLTPDEAAPAGPLDRTTTLELILATKVVFVVFVHIQLTGSDDTFNLGLGGSAQLGGHHWFQQETWDDVTHL